jgi:DNA topoisomerase-1
MKDKWNTLQHNGILFPKPYEYRSYKILVGEKEYTLSPQAEEMVHAWAAKLETPYVKDRMFQKNFWEDLQKEVPTEIKKSKFPNDWDLTGIFKDIQKRKEEKKAVSLEIRKKEKEDRETLKAVYGKAILDGIEVDIGNFTVEPAGIFMGRGDHKLRGHWKKQAQPEDITINFSKGLPVPPAPQGHTWKAVVENKGAFWTAMWIESCTGIQKKILFSANSFVKQNSDKKKFQKAIDLANNFDKVTAFIQTKLQSEDILTREIATVCELIRLLSIRVGDEKDVEICADTRGASSLCVENIKINGVDLSKIKNIEDLNGKM